MRDEPTGRYAVKLQGKPLTARTFHLYKDCGHMFAKAGEEDVAEILEPSDDIVALLEMRVCSACKTRSEEIPAVDIIQDEIKAGGTATEIVTALGVYGYEIKRVRKGGAK